ncbi:MAG: response regulator [Magnetococcales bacterium]|nr:response regulator [Magnetococcales bacterium]
MADAEIQTLLIEDDPRFADLMVAWLDEAPSSARAESPHPRLRLIHVMTLREGLERLDRGGVDIVLADLNLPDSIGLATCDRLLSHESRVPLLVMSGLDDELLAMRAVGLGAQDYLVKNMLDGHVLVRSVRYALERSRLQRELEETRQNQARRREQAAMDQVNERVATSVAASAMGERGLMAYAPELFDDMVRRMRRMLAQKLEMRAYKVIHPVSRELRLLATDMGELRCGPRDVVEIYRAAMIELEVHASPQRCETLREEGRFLAFELMGYMVSCYRPYALGGEGRRVAFTSGQEPIPRNGAPPQQG